LLLFPLTLLATELASGHSEAVENVYSRRIYPVLSQAWGFLFGLFHFSVIEILLYLAVLFVAFLLGFTIVRMIPRPYRIYRLARLIVGMALAAVALYAFFIGIWGLNYHRMPLANRLGWTTRASSAQELTALCEELILRANAVRETLAEDANGVVDPGLAKEEILGMIPDAYDKLSQRFEWVSGSYSAPKPVLASGRLCYTQITGVFSPFTIEANVNVAVPYPLLGSTAAHEAAHQRGFAREDEANFMSYLACEASGDPYLEYSGLLLAVIYSMNALYSADTDVHRELYGLYCDGIRRDLQANSDFWDRYKGRVAETSTQINNTYLQSNKQADGVKSYGRMVDLLLAERRNRLGLD
jgi:hypothetical protein